MRRLCASLDETRIDGYNSAAFRNVSPVEARFFARSIQ